MNSLTIHGKTPNPADGSDSYSELVHRDDPVRFDRLRRGARVKGSSRAWVMRPDERTLVEWRLSASPGLSWVTSFLLAEEGATQPISGGGPGVTENIIWWFVPVSDIENVDTYVKERLAVANDEQRGDVSPRRLAHDPGSRIRTGLSSRLGGRQHRCQDEITTRVIGRSADSERRK